MNNLFKTLIAGYGAKKLGGGCFSTILIFVVIYWALGTCNRHADSTQPVRPASEMHKTVPSEKIVAQARY